MDLSDVPPSELIKLKDSHSNPLKKRGKSKAKKHPKPADPKSARKPKDNEMEKGKEIGKEKGKEKVAADGECEGASVKQLETVASDRRTAQLVHLNIGGYRFTTSRETLQRVPDSFFTALLAGEIPSTVDNEGAYFIDRDGRYFEPLLNFLRTDQLIVPKHMSVEAVLREADFYCLQPIVEHLRREAGGPCGGRLFLSMMKANDVSSPVKHLTNCENYLVVACANGMITCYMYGTTSGWVTEFETDEFVGADCPEIENLAFFSVATGRWFLAVFAAGRGVVLWNKDGKLGVVSLEDCTHIDVFYFVRKGQNLVCINYDAGRVFILSLASLNVRDLSTSPNSISCSCYDSNHVASYCCSAGTIFQLLIGHDDNTRLKEVFTDPERDQITAICMREYRSMFYGTASGTIRRLDFSELGGTPQATLLLSGHIYPIVDLLPLGNRTLVSECAEGHIRCWNNSDISMMSSYTSPKGAQLLEPYILRSSDDTIEIFDILTGGLVESLSSVRYSPITCFILCSDPVFLGGSLLVTGHTDGTLQYWGLGVLSMLMKMNDRVKAYAQLPSSPPF